MGILLNHFDLLAPLYDRFIKSTDPIKIKQLAGLPVNGRLLDAGGGTGRISYWLKELVNFVVIADSSIGMLFQASKKKSLASVCSNSEQLPFRSESFERVIMVDALHHVVDYKRTLDELWRVVKPGGRIIIEEPDIRKLPVKIIAFLEKLTLMRSHFVSLTRIQDSFSYPKSSIRIESEGVNTWLIIEKLGG